MKKYLLVILLVVVLGVGGFYVFSQKPSPIEVTPSPIVSIKEFTMTAKQWEFNPAIINVNKGDKVKLKITATDVTHGFSLPDFNVKIDLSPNVETVVEFTADKPGEFTFFCSVFCGEGHKDMKGTLIVK